MTVAVVMEYEGATLDQYDEVIEILGFEPGGAGATGGLFHWVAATPTGLRITDVWESQEAFEHFARDHIMPAAQKVGVAGAPTITVTDVHSYLTAG
jgi:hypothetical protein